jgi:putative colanic acid biosynthesis UDP-glucose lipid carrier transferase
LGLVHPRGDYRFRFAPTPVGGAAKRAFDVVVAASALLFLTPLFLLVSLLIRLDSPGPALFRQKRTGFRGRMFKVFKFRTMSRMENGPDIAQAQRDDHRVTRLGRFLRRTSIDELPQLLNVLRGDMSLIGPRPHALAHDEKFYRTSAIYPKRFTARPGLTGLAQVSGQRGLAETDERINARLQKDLDYIENWSFGGDIAILWRTVLVVLHDPNAF